MRYLVELTREYAAKNKLQLEIINMLKNDYHRIMVKEEEAKPLVNTIQQKILAIESKHPRCKPIDVIYTEYSQDRNFKDQMLYNPDLFTIHFKGEKV
jgi:predicted AlkP superfamily phosphohydrolase/phosphomutase